jgi:OOP family OmpA-OmpF porin
MNAPQFQKHLLILAVAALLASLAPTGAVAQERPPGEIGLLLGVMRLDRDAVGPAQDPAYPAVIGLRLGANMHRPVSYFVEGLYSSFESDLLSDNSNIIEMRAGLERNFGGWYLAGAIGYADLNNPTGTDDFGRPLVSAGIGLRSMATHGVRWHLELREEVWMGDEGVNGFDIANTQLLAGLGMGLRARDGDPDDDGDGVPNRIDRCAGTPRGTRVDVYGCPEKRKALFEEGKRSLVLDGVNFVTDSADLTPESQDILDRVAESLADWPEVKVEVGGHTDTVADAAYNQSLSQRRAESVRRYLMHKGISGKRLRAKGYGETHPVATNDTAEGRMRNRRVELTRID